MFVLPFSNHVKLSATQALLNSLEFTRANFEKEVRASLYSLYSPKITDPQAYLKVLIDLM